jgi:hypothetical protein
MTQRYSAADTKWKQGHAKAIAINFGFARYHGGVTVRTLCATRT